MPPARPVFRRCTCDECINTNVHGVLMDSKLIPAHLKRVQVERSKVTSQKIAPSSTNPDSLVAPDDDIASHIFALTLTDDGPHPNAKASRLWESRSAYQDIGPSRDIIASSPDPLAIADIAKSLCRLTLQSPAPDVSAGEPSSAADHTPKTRASSNGLSKKDTNRHSVKALELIANIERRCEQCSRLLLDPSSESVATVHRELVTLRQALTGVRRNTATIQSRKAEVSRALDNLERECQSRAPPLSPPGPLEIDTSEQDQSPIERMHIIAQLALIIGLVCNITMGISESGGNFILNVLSLLLYLAFQRSDGTLSDFHESVLRQILATIHTALARFNLNYKTISFATCICHATYAPSYAAGSNVPIYPELCTHHPSLETECGEPLLDTRPSGARSPKRTFVYRDFNDYLANLLSRQDVEALMDQACDELFASLSEPPPRFVKHPFEAQFLREFHGPIPDKLFIDRGDEGRYAFALHVDFFNPEGMRIRGASASTGIISMACLNLPPHLRYKPENLFLAGIIPGPKQPSLESLNHYIRPLVHDLSVSWGRGVRYSRTANYPNGRVTRSAIALTVCDLPTACHLNAFAGVHSHFICGTCNCYHKNSYSRVDFDDWEPRDKDKLRRYAELWRDAPTSAERECLFKEHGVRWTELWRLPYWDPARQSVVDTMHCILEGLVAHHSRNLLRITNEDISHATKNAPAFQYAFKPLKPSDAAALSMTTKEVAQVPAIHNLLVTQVSHPHNSASLDAFVAKLRGGLYRKNARALQYVCQTLGCMPTKLLKTDYVNALVSWRRQMPLAAAATPSHQESTGEALQRIREVIRDISVPSWFESAPRNFGDASAGTIKAAEWRSLITVYIPLGLISIWGTCDSDSDAKAVLDHTMSLVSAVYVACARTMTVKRASVYCSCIANYVGNLTHLYPTVPPRPNHHAAFHIFDYLVLFGPVHSWWTFPFERLIGVLQRLPSNHKFGELENTMFHSYLKGAMLRAWLSRPNCPTSIRECKVLLDLAYRSHVDADSANDDGLVLRSQAENPQPTAAPADLQRLIGKLKVVQRAHVKHTTGVSYSRSSTHVGNSLILFYPNGNRSSAPVPGSIKYIYQVTDSFQFAVQRQHSLGARRSNIADAFSAYPHFPAKVYSSDLETMLESVQCSWVYSHYARWAVSKEAVVVLTLSKD